MADNVMIPDMLKSFRHDQNAQNPGILEVSLFVGQVYRMARELPLASMLSFKKCDNGHTKSLHSLCPLWLMGEGSF